MPDADSGSDPGVRVRRPGPESAPAGAEWIRAQVVVRGRVQGVFFRATAQDHGASLGLTGWIRNLPDGRVEAVLEGPRDRVDEMVQWCRCGPPLARVEGLDLAWLPATREFTTLRVTF